MTKTNKNNPDYSQMNVEELRIRYINSLTDEIAKKYCTELESRCIDHDSLRRIKQEREEAKDMHPTIACAIDELIFDGGLSVATQKKVDAIKARREFS